MLENTELLLCQGCVVNRSQHSLKHFQKGGSGNDNVSIDMQRHAKELESVGLCRWDFVTTDGETLVHSLPS